MKDIKKMVQTYKENLILNQLENKKQIPASAFESIEEVYQFVKKYDIKFKLNLETECFEVQDE